MERVPAGFRALDQVLDWTLCVDVSDRRARPYFYRRGMLRTSFEAAKLTDGKALFVAIHELWKKARLDYQGPWREDPRFRAIDYARDAIRNELMFQRRWDPELAAA
jgi:hypothetical protein